MTDFFLIAQNETQRHKIYNQSTTDAVGLATPNVCHVTKFKCLNKTL